MSSPTTKRRDETWREVVAEMRNFACELKGNLGPKSNWSERTDRADDLLLFADRIEAAAKEVEREIATLNEVAVNLQRSRAKVLEQLETVTKRNGFGNAARVRAVLERIIKCQCTICPDHGPLGCEAKHLIGLCKLLQSARDILAATPRNCDRFATVKEAAIAYAKEERPEPNTPDFTFSVWLFATATPEKGGEG